jgi:hypothetical protein
MIWFCPPTSKEFKVEISLKFSTEEIEQKKTKPRKRKKSEMSKKCFRCLAQKRGPKRILSKRVDSARRGAARALFLALFSSFKSF